jgi:type I restriction enzyme R subunit
MLEKAGFTKVLGREWFWLGYNLLREKKTDEGLAAYAKAEEILTDSDAYRALIPCAQRMAEVLDSSVTSEASENQSDQFVIHQGKVIDLSKIDVDKIRKEIKHAECKAIQIEDVRAFIEKLLQQLINKNCTRIAFSERYRHIIDQYNAGSTANEEYYEKLLQLIDELKQEQSRAQVEGMTDEELEIYDLLIEDKILTKAELQKVKLAAKNLYQKLVEKKDELMVIDWYKDDQPVQKVRYVIQTTLNTDLPMSYDKSVFNAKTDLLLNHFIDMAVQGYGWVS